MPMDKDLPKQILEDMYITSRSKLQMQESLAPVNVHLKNRSFINILEKHLLLFSRYLQLQIKQHRNTAREELAGSRVFSERIPGPESLGSTLSARGLCKPVYRGSERAARTHR